MICSTNLLSKQKPVNRLMNEMFVLKYELESILFSSATKAVERITNLASSKSSS